MTAPIAERSRPDEFPSAPVDERVRAAWEWAQDLWGIRMHDPELRIGAGAVVGSHAWFGFPPAVGIDPVALEEIGFTDDLRSIFAHELGHHVLAPGTRIDALKIRHQLARALIATGARTTRVEWLDRLSNLWTDLLVNARVAVLERGAEPEREAGIVRTRRIGFAVAFDHPDRLWWVVRRCYELLWSLPGGTFCPAAPPAAPEPHAADTVGGSPVRSLDDVPEEFREQEQRLREAQQAAEAVAAELAATTMMNPELDAVIAARLVRTFSTDPVAGALPFGMIAAPYLLEAVAEAMRVQFRGDDGPAFPAGALGGAGECSVDDAPATAAELGRILGDRRLQAAPRHPREDAAARHGGEAPVEGDDDTAGSNGAGQTFGVAQTLALYDGSDAGAVVAAWYRTRAAPWVRPYTERRPDRPATELPGPIEQWQMGDDLADIDWSATFQAGAEPIPGVTTKRRSWLEDEAEPVEASISLDLYLDSSGSMPHPRRGSPAVLAGTILVLSVLRGGGRVRVTSFSAPGQVAGTERFTSDPVAAVDGLAVFFGGGTSFPLDVYARRYERLAPPTGDERRHVVVLSDDGLTSMFGVGNQPFSHVAAAVRAKLTTGTLMLLDPRRSVSALAATAGYETIFLDRMDDAPAACARLAEVLHG